MKITLDELLLGFVLQNPLIYWFEVYWRLLSYLCLTLILGCTLLVFLIRVDDKRGVSPCSRMTLWHFLALFNQLFGLLVDFCNRLFFMFELLSLFMTMSYSYYL